MNASALDKSVHMGNTPSPPPVIQSHTIWEIMMWIKRLHYIFLEVLLLQRMRVMHDNVKYNRMYFSPFLFTAAEATISVCAFEAKTELWRQQSNTGFGSALRSLELLLGFATREKESCCHQRKDIGTFTHCTQQPPWRPIVGSIRQSSSFAHFSHPNPLSLFWPRLAPQKGMSWSRGGQWNDSSSPRDMTFLYRNNSAL